MIDKMNKDDNKSMFFKIVGMLFFLWLFLLSIKLLGTVFEHYFFDNSADLIKNVCDNPFVALFIGILTTALMNSSSTTTSIIVAFVGAGTIPYESAVPMVFGANIGSAVTGILVSFGQVKNKMEFHRSFSAAIVHDFFNWSCVLLFFPLELMTGLVSKSAKALTSLLVGGSAIKFNSPLDTIVKPITKFIENFIAELMNYEVSEHIVGDKINQYPVYNGILLTIMIIISLLMLFVSLKYMSSIMKKILIGKFEKIIHKFVFNNMATAFLFGLIFTLSVQSSAITIALVVPLVGSGILTLEQIFPYAVGANIGTTITGILAALVTGNASGISIALAHTIFNAFGSFVFIPLRKIPISAAKWFSLKVKENRLWAVGFLMTMYFLLPIIVIYFSS